eukprot:996695-Pyramimonas_sp.AAC.1
MAGKLLRTIYGTRDVANQWDSFFQDIIIKLGYDVGVSNHCTDAGASGLDHMNSLFDEIGKHLILKNRGLFGFEDGDDTDITILNRLDCYTTDGVPTVTYEPDPRHVDLLVDQLGLAGGEVEA